LHSVPNRIIMLLTQEHDISTIKPINHGGPLKRVASPAIENDKIATYRHERPLYRYLFGATRWKGCQQEA
jgi:hypothetical protein